MFSMKDTVFNMILLPDNIYETIFLKQQLNYHNFKLFLYQDYLDSLDANF